MPRLELPHQRDDRAAIVFAVLAVLAGAALAVSCGFAGRSCTAWRQAPVPGNALPDCAGHLSASEGDVITCICE